VFRTNPVQESLAVTYNLQNYPRCKISSNTQSGYYNTTTVVEADYGKASIDPTYYRNKLLPYLINPAGTAYMVQVCVVVPYRDMHALKLQH
jgi:hypothetical protein